MKENHLIGNILSEQGNDDVPNIIQPPLSRSSSAPPIMPEPQHEFKITSPVSGEQVSSTDFRLNPQYAVYYYSRRPLDPRLPPPLVSPFGYYPVQPNGGTDPAILAAAQYKSNDTVQPQPQQASRLSASAQASAWSDKPKTLVDLIQQDFPRTPSPIFQKTNEDMIVPGQPLPQQQQQQQSQQPRGSLQRQQGPYGNAFANDDLVNSMSSMSLGAKELADGVAQQQQQQQMQQTARAVYTDPNAYAYYSNVYPQYGVGVFSGGSVGGVPSAMYTAGGRTMSNPNNMNPNVNPNEYYDSRGRMGGAAGMMYNNQNTGYLHPQQYSMQAPMQQNQQYQNQQYQNQQYQNQQYQNDRGVGRRGSQHRHNNNNNNNNGHQPTLAQQIQMEQQQQLQQQQMDERRSTKVPRGPLLEEFRNNKTRKFELIDIVGNVVEFSQDQHGSRFIQEKLKTATDEERDAVFKEILPQSLNLMKDVFGNYVIQKFFDYGSQDQKHQVAQQLIGHVLTLSIHMYGCRVVQKALESVDADLQERLSRELDGSIMKCVRDQNGNHVIQKCIEKIQPHATQFIVDAFQGQVFAQATHPYGCRVIQRILEHCTEKQQDLILDEIARTAPALVQDQYGNYVIQHVLEHGKRKDKSNIIAKLRGQLLPMSQHKFASNVVEKCIEFGTPQERTLMMKEIVDGKPVDGQAALLIMMKDQYANYVIQKILDVLDDAGRDFLVNKIKPHIPTLRKFMYGKHIITRVEKYLAARGPSPQMMQPIQQE